MRRRARSDDNQSAVVEALRTCGFTVQVLSSVGCGCPDLLVGKNRVNVLFEVKDGNKAASRRTLTKDETDWHRDWRGQVAVVEFPAEAVLIAADLCRSRLPAFQ